MPPKTPPKQVKEDLQAGLQALTVVYTRVRMRPVIPDKTDDRYSTPDKSWGTGKKVRLPYQKVLDAVIDQVNIDRNAAGRDELGEGAVLNQVISKRRADRRPCLAWVRTPNLVHHNPDH